MSGGVDESSNFSEADFFAALLRVSDAIEAARVAHTLAPRRDPDDSGPPWQLSPEILDLLSLVSEDCAERVRTILNLSASDAAARRAATAERFPERRS